MISARISTEKSPSAVGSGRSTASAWARFSHGNNSSRLDINAEYSNATLGLFITISSCGHADLLTLDTSVTNCSSDRYRRDPNSHRISSNMGTFLQNYTTHDSSPLFKESR